MHTCIGAECFSSQRPKKMRGVHNELGGGGGGGEKQAPSAHCFCEIWFTHVLLMPHPFPTKANLGNLLLIELLKTTGSATICGFMQELNRSCR